MKIEKEKIYDTVCSAVFTAMERHGVKVRDLGEIFNSIKNGATVYFKFDPNVWACDCTVHLDLICKHRAIPFLASEPTEFNPRIRVAWGSYQHPIASGAVAVREYAKALAFATELEAALGGIEVKKE